MAEQGESGHDRYWRGVAESAKRRIESVFHGSSRSVADVVGDGDGLDDRRDVEMVLAHVLAYGDCSERARTALASFELLQAWHELSEHRA